MSEKGWPPQEEEPSAQRGQRQVTTSEHRFQATETTGEVSAILVRPEDARWMYVFGHGSGAGMRHVFMEECAALLAIHGVATFRYQFPYMEAGQSIPNRAPVLIETVRSAVGAAESLEPDLPLLAGGKSMGGRMTSAAAALRPLGSVLGLAFFGFPLHPSGRESSERGDHLRNVGLPMLFLQGSRDKLANLSLLSSLLDGVGTLTTLNVLQGADHGFHVLKRSGRTESEVLEEACVGFSKWARKLVAC
tara:strand:- start:768 stop:1511 length:744 start_codon:yes stop_codon:yes gene_type:complete